MAFLPGQAPPRRAVLLVNPGARRGGDAIDGVLARLRAGGVAVREAELGSPEEIERHIREGDEPTAPDCAIVCGGDGSLCLAAPGLLATGRRPSASCPWAPPTTSRAPSASPTTSRPPPRSSSPAAAGASTSAR